MSSNLHSRYKTTYRQRGLTLIELLTVIAIVGVIAAILVPTLSKARNSLNKAKCVSNQRQLAIGALAYASDNNGRLPATDRSATPLITRWIFQVAPYVGSGGDPDKPNIGTITAMFQCPVDREAIAAFLGGDHGWPGTSYLHMLPYPFTHREGGVPITMLPQVEEPGSHPMLVCAWETGSSFYQRNSEFVKHVKRSPEGFMHGDGANVAYYDGSVRFVKNPTWTSIRGFADQ